MDETVARSQMLAGIPVTSRRMEVAGIDTALLEAGHGPPLMLLHGAIERGGAVWAPVMNELARHNRLLIPDLPGLGASFPAPHLDTATIVRWFNALIDATAFDGCTLVAHSMGGSLAARWATTHGSRVSRLVIVAAPAVGDYRMPARLVYVAARATLRPTARNSERFTRFALRDLDATRKLDPQWYEAWDVYTRARADDPSVKRTMGELINEQRKPIEHTALRQIPVPTTLLWGREDRMVPLRVAEGASDRLGWPLKVVEGAAHVPHGVPRVVRRGRWRRQRCPPTERVTWLRRSLARIGGGTGTVEPQDGSTRGSGSLLDIRTSVRVECGHLGAVAPALPVVALFVWRSAWPRSCWRA